MDHYRDERIVCVSCGSSFVFTASEAAHFAERGLSAPPKRCRDCRRARKEQLGGAGRPQNGGFGRYAGGAPGRYDNAGGAGLSDDRGNVAPQMHGGGRGPRMPSHTGNVNEYRSPMQVGSQPSQPDYRAPMRGGGYSGQSDYRSPMQGGAPGQGRRGPPRARSRGPRVAAVNDGNYRAPAFREGNDAPRAQARAAPRPASPPREPRVREMFSITCNACGAESQVPFRPDEGREVFCQACYRARKPS
jgi:CxxC-x17-CxxC domain-containing protein